MTARIPGAPQAAKRTTAKRTTVWVLGDQLNRSISSLEGADPASTVVLMVRSEAKVMARPWHRQRLHAILAGMARFAAELRAEGFEVDERQAATFEDGLTAHRAEYRPTVVRVMAPESFAGRALARRVGLEVVESNLFLTTTGEFARWAAGGGGVRGRLRMEDFYRWQRRRLGILMDGDQPCGGRWNFDHDNRLPPPREPVDWPGVVSDPLDDLDGRILASLPGGAVGEEPNGWWATDRAGALARLESFVAGGLDRFGPYEDAMLAGQPTMAHSMLSQALNLGLLHPREVCQSVESAYRDGRVSVASAEGFIRQVIGWREYVRGLYWLWGPGYGELNALAAERPLPPALSRGETAMRCVQVTVGDVHRHGWVHHIQRLMILANLCTLAGVNPQEVVAWMWEMFVDGAEWVMLPNVIGMGLHADGGMMATKPYVSGGAYIRRMSDYCDGCRYDPRRRVGDDACPFTTLYWSFLDTHSGTFVANPRMSRQVKGVDRLGDIEGVRSRSEEVLRLLDAGLL